MAGEYHEGYELDSGFRLEKHLSRGPLGDLWRVVGPGGIIGALKIIDLQQGCALRSWSALGRLKEVRNPHLQPMTAIWFRDGRGRIARCDGRAPPETGSKSSRLSSDPHPRDLLVLTPLYDQNLLDRLVECRQKGVHGIPVEELLAYMKCAAIGVDMLNRTSIDLGEGAPTSVQHGRIKPENLMLLKSKSSADADIALSVCDYFQSTCLIYERGTTRDESATSRVYTAPEVLEGGEHGARSDQYSLAIVYCQLRTGSLPFPAGTSGVDELDLSRLLQREATAIAKATRVNPAERFESCSELVRSLQLLD